jgi:hypothetical protein
MHVVRDFVFINRTLDLPGPVRVYARGLESCDPPLCRNSDWWIGFPGCLDELDVYYFFLQIRDTLVAEFFPEPEGMTNNTLVVHLRGGDEARLMPAHNQYYGQPPCQYFLDVIHQFPESFLLTDGVSPSDGRWNPCHNRIVTAGAKTTNADLRHDFEMMIWSRNFVLSVSTLSFAAMWLSPIKKRFWTFNNYFQIRDVAPEHPQGNFKHIGEHWNCVASPEYVQEVLQSWGATDAQFERLVRDECKWVTVPRVPPEAWPLTIVHGVL